MLTALPLIAGGCLWLRTASIEFAVAALVLTPIVWLVARVLLELFDVVAATLLSR